MTALSLSLDVLLALGILYIIFKLRRIHTRLFEHDRLAQVRSDNQYTQLTTLLALESELKLQVSLPATRGWAASPDFLLHVLRVAQRVKPQVVVECSSGTSTVVIARALQLAGEGHLFSLEHDSVYAQRTRNELRRHGLELHATVIDAPLVEVSVAGTQARWYEHSEVPSGIDMLVIDGPPISTQPLARFPAVPLLLGRMSKSSHVILDDANRPDERECVERWIKDFGLQSTGETHAEKGIAILHRI